MPEPPVLPPIATAPLSVVLLARNAEPQLRDVVAAWRDEAEKLQRPYELLITDTGSTDRTAAIAEELAGLFPQVRLVRDPDRQGVGAALRAGVAAAQYPLLVWAPATREFAPSDLSLLMNEIDKVHLVNGFRVGRPVPLPLRLIGIIWRSLLHVVFVIALDPLPGWLGWRGHLHAWMLRVFFGVRLRDVGSPLRLFRRSLFARIPIQAHGSFALDEVLAKANFLGAVMTEVSVPHRPSEAASETESFRHTLDEALRIFSHPNFGPATLPPGAEEPAAAAPGELGTGM